MTVKACSILSCINAKKSTAKTHADNFVAKGAAIARICVAMKMFSETEGSDEDDGRRRPE